MEVIFISNFFNHHQKPFCDSMYEHYGNDFIFLATSVMPEWRKSLGYSELNANYVRDLDSIDRQIIDDSEIVIKGDAPYSLIANRLRNRKLTFFYSERIYKSSVPWLKLPIHAIMNYYQYGRYKNVYMLCASAYTSYDYSLTHCFINKCFKWGYFPQVVQYESVDDLIASRRENNGSLISILWAARTIHWKHPEAMLYLARTLLDKGYKFHIDMIGNGEMDDILKDRIGADGLEGIVSLLGPMPPDRVRSHMEKADIFILSSDRNEGWGAVLNEAMNSACAVVASNRIGSVPFLIRNGENGIVFNDCDWFDLFEKVRFLIDNPVEMLNMSLSAYKTIASVWNADNAVNNLLILFESLKRRTPAMIPEGPCSVAPIIKG